MEVTTVSPSPDSPTEGDNLCETDVTNVAIHSVTLLLCLCGLVGNGAVLCLLSLKLRNIFIFALAFADFLFLLFTAPCALLFLVEDLSCSPIVPMLYLSFLFQLPVISYYWMLYRLTDTCNIVDVFKLCCPCSPPRRLWWLVDRFQFWAFFVLFTVVPAVTNLCPTHEQGHCQAALISVYAVILLLCVVPKVIFQTMKFIKAKWGSEKQKPKMGDIVLFLVVLFILLLGLYNFLQQLGYIAVPSQVFFLLNCIHSSIKPFIYFLAGRCWSPCSLSSLRLSLQRVFDEEKEKTDRSNAAFKDILSSLQRASDKEEEDPALSIDALNDAMSSLLLYVQTGSVKEVEEMALSNDDLKENMSSFQLYLQRVFDEKKEKTDRSNVAFKDTLNSLQRVFDEEEEEIALSNDAPKDTGL